MIFNVSCISTRMFKDHKGINSEFTPYVEDFVISSNGLVTESDIKSLSMGFVEYEKGSTTAGTCMRTPWFNEIDIGNQGWIKIHLQ